jgi:hypothetical protein
MKISESEVFRYLGYHNIPTDEHIVSQVALVSEEVISNVNPKNVFGIWECQIEEDFVTFGSVSIKSCDLIYHLQNCDSVVLLAVTLGTVADVLINRYNMLDIEKALIAQAVCTVMIEQYCDEIISEVMQNPRLSELYPIAPFSPGYGDFDIKWQKDILKLLNAKNRIALFLSDGYMLIPSKSITAIIGFSKKKQDIYEKCTCCTNTQCAYRKIH